MELTEELIIHIENLEGFKEDAYLDKRGTPTIGFGHTNATKTYDFEMGDSVSREEALDILKLDLAHARGTVENLIRNSSNVTIEDYSEERLEYATLVYFNRPWALRDIGGELGTYAGLELIADGSLEEVVAYQLEAFKKRVNPKTGELVYGENLPDWVTNRINKEEKYTTFPIVEVEEEEEDPPGPSWGDEFRFVGTEVITPEATKEVWSKVLQKLYGVNNPFERESINKNNQPEISVRWAKPYPPHVRFGNAFKSLGRNIRNNINDTIDAQLDFTENVYNKDKEE